MVEDLQGKQHQMVAALTSADTKMKTFALDPSQPIRGRRDAPLSNWVACSATISLHEERTMEHFSATHKHTKEHKAAEAAARKAHTEKAGTFFAWLNDHCDSDAARALRREVSAPVLLFILVGGRHYNRRIASAWG